MSSSTERPVFTLQLTAEDLSDFLDGALPAAARPAFGQVVAVAPGHVRMCVEPTAEMVRPGNIVSGPSLMGIADVAAYAVVLAHVGAVPMAVTNALNISFLRSCRLATFFADARLLKLGRQIATVDVRLWQETEARLLAQATVSYTRP